MKRNRGSGGIFAGRGGEGDAAAHHGGPMPAWIGGNACLGNLQLRRMAQQSAIEFIAMARDGMAKPRAALEWSIVAFRHCCNVFKSIPGRHYHNGPSCEQARSE